MKTLITLLLLSLTLGLTAQQYICFPREKQADRQTDRLNVSNYRMVWNKETKEYDHKFRYYFKTDTGFCIKITCEDKGLKFGYYENKLVIKKRHYKYISKPEKQFFNLDDCYLRHDKSKFQKFIGKLKKE